MFNNKIHQYASTSCDVNINRQFAINIFYLKNFLNIKNPVWLINQTGFFMFNFKLVEQNLVIKLLSIVLNFSIVL